MRVTGVVFALALIAGLTAFSLHQQAAAERAVATLGRMGSSDADSPPVAALVSTSRDAAARDPDGETGRLEPIRVQASIAAPPRGATAQGGQPGPPPAAAPEAPRIQERPQQEARESSRRRSSRWRSRNRYPGPIPTPAEWEAPPGPVKIALQAGHWRAHEAPSELSGLKDNGTSANGQPEWEVNLEVVRHAAAQLQELGYEVDILPAVVPPDYRAHLFIAVHADGSADPAATGYRVAAPRRDATGRAAHFVELLERSYGAATGIRLLPTVTRRMQSYYAFNYRRYEHALHPMTIGVILETGFLTSARDRRVIVENPERAARGIVEAVKAFPVTALTEVAAGR